MSQEPEAGLPRGTLGQAPRDAGAAAIELSALTPLPLGGRPQAYVIRAGYADVFFLGAAGTRHHLARFTQGQTLIGSEAESSLVAVGSQACVVQSLSRRALGMLPVAQQAAVLDTWVSALADSAFGRSPAWPDAAEGESLLRLAPGDSLYAPRGVSWAQVAEGSLAVGGTAGTVGAGDGLPLAEGLGLSALTAAAVALHPTEVAIAQQQVFAPLERFHLAVEAALRAGADASAGRARDRLLRRERAAGLHMAGALRRMAQILQPSGDAALPAERTHSLIAAFAAVAEALGADYRPAAHGEAAPASLPALARAGGLGLRTVQLRPDWWREDGGPLLAFRAPDGAAVALLPAGRGYRLLDGASGAVMPVDAALADSLSAQAVMFYRPLPAAVHRMHKLLLFGLRGGARDGLAIALMGLLGAALAAGVPVAMGLVFQWIIPHAELHQLPGIIGGLAAAACGAAAFELTRMVALLRLQNRMEALLQPALMQRLLSLPVKFFRGFSVGDLADRVLGVQRIRRLLTGATLASIIAGAFSLFSFGVIAVYSGRLALVAAALVLFATAVTSTLALLQLRHERAATELRGREDGLAVQMIQGIAKIRVAAAEPRLFTLWAELFGRHKARRLQAQRWANRRDIFNGVFPLPAALALYAAAAPLAAAGGRLSLGGFLAVLAAFGQLLTAMTALAGALAAALEAVPLFERLRPIVEAPPEAQGDGTDPGPITGAIEVSQLSFRYVAQGPLVLDGVSLRIEPGQLVAIVGASGSGKSSLLRLLLAFETPESGEILIQGRPLGTLDPAALRRRIGVVLQHGRISTGSIYENITGGLPYPLDDAWAAARLAGLDAEIEAMPMGMHTLLMEGVPTLSGGQFQRLMIARALIGKPQVLMFDEATSALDNRSQAVVTASLKRLRTTRIVIAHRLSTVRDADRIFVLERGRLVQAGSYAELMAQDGAFRTLARRQIL